MPPPLYNPKQDAERVDNLDAVDVPGPYLLVKWPDHFQLTAPSGELWGQFSNDWVIRDKDTGAYVYNDPDGGRTYYLRVVRIKRNKYTIADGGGTLTEYTLQPIPPFEFT